MTPLRQSMMDAMLQRGYAASTQANYVEAIYSMAKYYRRDPAEYSVAEVQAYLLHMVKERQVCAYLKPVPCGCEILTAPLTACAFG